MHVTIEKEELGAGTMNVGMGVAFAGNGREAAIVKEPDEG